VHAKAARAAPSRVTSCLDSSFTAARAAGENGKTNDLVYVRERSPSVALKVAPITSSYKRGARCLRQALPESQIDSAALSADDREH